jgi:hypothetical protein
VTNVQETPCPQLHPQTYDEFDEQEIKHPFLELDLVQIVAKCSKLNGYFEDVDFHPFW